MSNLLDFSKILTLIKKKVCQNKSVTVIQTHNLSLRIDYIPIDYLVSLISLCNAFLNKSFAGVEKIFPKRFLMHFSLLSKNTKEKQNISYYILEYFFSIVICTFLKEINFKR